MGVDGALRTAVHAWYMPIPGTGRARLAVSAVVLFVAPVAADRCACACFYSACRVVVRVGAWARSAGISWHALAI
ncbi:hypothetical protein XOC_2995 [Xanthomonas oryzae pv. oryzicola BLS256]|uniref:Uncharacterized protein n=1 Tax=Xanthomonas oryzae pv. oryzicola (strain BLS256) TaxID=383407 RepID=G7TL52_XANOB|nr:hypothetical protein XOC_2995 [Xanthomonas oryzae pv. oryzicola BLS256]